MKNIGFPSSAISISKSFHESNYENSFLFFFYGISLFHNCFHEQGLRYSWVFLLFFIQQFRSTFEDRTFSSILMHANSEKDTYKAQLISCGYERESLNYYSNYLDLAQVQWANEVLFMEC